MGKNLLQIDYFQFAQIVCLRNTAVPNHTAILEDVSKEALTCVVLGTLYFKKLTFLMKAYSDSRCAKANITPAGCRQEGMEFCVSDSCYF